MSKCLCFYTANCNLAKFLMDHMEQDTCYLLESGRLIGCSLTPDINGSGF